MQTFFLFVSREEFSRMPLKLEQVLRTFPDPEWQTQWKAVVLQEFRMSLSWWVLKESPEPRCFCGAA